MRRFLFSPQPIAVLAGLLAGTLTTCQPPHSAQLEERQQANLGVVKQLQRCLNGQDWPGVKRLFAGRVRCKGPATHYAEVELPPLGVLTGYRPSGPAPPRLEITQLYAASEHHVVAEARLGGLTPVCLIYTIEGGKITRQYTY